MTKKVPHNEGVQHVRSVLASFPRETQRAIVLDVLAELVEREHAANIIRGWEIDMDRDKKWDTSVKHLESLIVATRSGAGTRPALTSELATLATSAFASSRTHTRDDVNTWAAALASDVADIDD